MSKLLCPKCEISGLTWEDVEQEDLLENGVMECDNPKCKAKFVGIKGWRKKESFNFYIPVDKKSKCVHQEPHRMKRYNCYDTRCIIPGCKFKV